VAVGLEATEDFQLNPLQLLPKNFHDVDDADELEAALA
jgi:hypothetical protein